jgi:hypothetical protein
LVALEVSATGNVGVEQRLEIEHTPFALCLNLDTRSANLAVDKTAPIRGKPLQGE